MRIPNDILVVAPQYTGANGSVQINDTIREVLINSLDDSTANDTPFLGKQFFSQAYLMVDFDENTFTLWEANATTETNLQTIGNSAGNCTHAAPNVSTHTTSPRSSTVNKSRAHSSLSAGALAGIVVGAALGTTAVGVVGAILILRRRRRNGLNKESSVSFVPQDHHSSNSQKQELDANQVLQEMEASHTHPQELPPDAKPTELSEGTIKHEMASGTRSVAELGSP